MRGRRQLAALLVGVLLSTGCAVGPIFSRSGNDGVGTVRAPARRAAERGADALADGKHTRASQLFNEALSLDPENPRLHLLNGFAYHAGYLEGTRGRAQLAETGYRIALQQAPGDWRAAYQLGLLYLDMRRYAVAQTHLAQAARLVEDEPDVHYALAVASYYQRDLEPALWAVRRAADLQPARSEFLKAAAMIAAAAGVTDEAARYFDRYRALEPEPVGVGHLARRMSQWTRIHERIARGEHRPLIAQAPPAPPPTPPGAGPPAAAAPPAARVPMAFSWNDCVQALNPQTQPPASPSTASLSGTADETTTLPALPSPCVGLPLPRMALVDVTLVRTEETRATGQGVNLLDGLRVVLGGSTTRSENDVTTLTNRIPSTVSTLTKTFTSSIALPAEGITYALNIANANDARVEVIARPTLISLDRTPSNFFSGSNVTIALAGQFGGNIQEKPVGVSLSVTPTFIDDETMLLSVKATRSFFERVDRGTFDQALSTTRNAVTANALIKYGQTLIISGMIERDLQDTDTGVPLIRDLPLVQYFFGRRETQDFRKEVVVILTPRRVSFLPEALRSVEDYLSRPDISPPPGYHDLDQIRAQARRAVTGVTPQVTAIIASLSDNLFFHEFRTGDLAPPRTHGGPDFRRILKEILELLYF